MARTPSDNSTLKRLIREAGYTYQTVDRKRVELLFGGPYRPWSIVAMLVDRWMNLCVYVCQIPEAAGQRAELMQLAMRLNGENRLGKYTFHKDDVLLEVDYRQEHLDADTMRGLVTLFTSIADNDYPRIARVVCGDATLDRLEESFKRS